jgi:hypothetical protein
MGLDRMDEDLIAFAYHDVGIDDSGGAPKSGHQFAHWVIDFLKRFRSTSDVITNALIAVDGEIAHSQAHFFA